MNARLISMLLLSQTAALTMTGHPDLEKERHVAMTKAIHEISITYWKTSAFFNVPEFKKYIVKHGANIQPKMLKEAQDAILATIQQSYLSYPQESREITVVKRDFTAAMIAINKLKPQTFQQDAIADGMKETMSLLAGSADGIHIAQHRWGLCPCTIYASCNWPEIEKNN